MLLLLVFHIASTLCLISPSQGDPIKGINSCMNNEDCIGANKRCHHNKTELTGTCTCRRGYVEKGGDSISCIKNRVMQECETDYDCREGDVCIIVRAPYLADRLLRMNEDGHDMHNQKICIGTWVIYADFEEPKTGGGLRSKFYPDDIFFKRGRRVPQQYLGFVEDMMLVLFLVCILVTLITVHRASCYRSLQDARRNTPLRHILPIAEDQPPPYSERLDSADGLTEVLSSNEANQPKRQSETPPPTYDEALYRNSVQLPREGAVASVQEESPPAIDDGSLPSYSETRIRIFENITPSTPPVSESNETQNSAAPCVDHEGQHATEEVRSLLTGSDKSTDVQKVEESPKVSSESTLTPRDESEDGTDQEENVDTSYCDVVLCS